MTTILSDTFTAALARLTNDEQKQVKLTAFDLQTDSNRPGLQFHRIDNARDAHFWSVRVSRDIRIIVHKSGASMMLVYVDHHDDAYRWAERRRIETHPKTGALQIAVVRERVVEIPTMAQSSFPFDAVADQLAAPTPLSNEPAIFSDLSQENLLSVGVPEDWLDDVATATEERFLTMAAHLPAEAGEALLEYAATGILHPAAGPTPDPLTHPDTLRRFRVMEGLEELQAALDAPFEKWTVFLHPAQSGMVERSYSGPARVAGSAGTGKTVVALHRVARAVHADAEARVLLATFSDPLADALAPKLSILLHEDDAAISRIAVASFRAIAEELYALVTGRKAHLADRELLRALIHKAAEGEGVTEFSTQFLVSEWEHVIDAWRIDSAEAYAAVPRMGRKNRLGVKQRERLWRVYAQVAETLRTRALMTAPMLFDAVRALYAERDHKPFRHIVVDEAQDLGVAELRFLASIATDGPDALFFAGDIGQRIFQQPFSWKGLGIDVRGRSLTLRVCYRTSHQIRRMADRLVPDVVRDVDGLEDDRRGTVSVFEGIEPQVVLADDEAGERDMLAAFLTQAREDGIAPAEIGVFYRSPAIRARALAGIEVAGLTARGHIRSSSANDAVLVASMHLAKGLEFRAVAVIGCDEGVLPLSGRVADVADEFELDELIATERHLLYVACTRARDRLLVTGVAPGSEFLDDLQFT